MKKYLLSILFFFFLLSAGAQVFLDEKVANLLDDNLIEMDNWQAINQVVVQQIGNVAYVNQAGSNQESALQQNGYQNEANLWQEGNLITQEVFQKGSENTINSYIKNTSLYEKTVFLMQNGNNNRIDLAIFGDEMAPTPQSIKITQEGNGFEANAFMESYHFPIEINQKAGAGGGEMKINVSTSFFSFPMK